jgi:hypothetical protein
MYVDTSTVQGKYTRHLLRESYREDGKVKHRTIASLSSCSPEEIEAIKLALRHKDNLQALVSVDEAISLHQGPSFGAAWLIYDLARQIGIKRALGTHREGKLTLFQVIARVLEQGSRLSAIRLAERHAISEILGLDNLREDDLYDNLSWLSTAQTGIENRLAPAEKSSLFLYDVTSSYLEGTKNELSAFGYNRDKKQGKRQIVIGLLCNADGYPLSIEVFAGNTQDTRTVASQIHKLAERFGGEVTLVGDSGMLKAPQIEELAEQSMHYITAITKPQIESLLSNGTIQMSMFDQELTEVEERGVRYILRRNPVRAKEIQASRADRLAALVKFVAGQNGYLSEHAKASPEIALRKVAAKCARLLLDKWVQVLSEGREVALVQDFERLAEISKLDGCYVLKTDLKSELAPKELIHSRYKDLAQVEWAFRTCKTTQLEVRPVHVRRADRTRGHVFVVMLAYCIVRELSRRWRDVNVTVEEGLSSLAGISTVEVRIKGRASCQKTLVPNELSAELLRKAGVTLPEIAPMRKGNVATRKKLHQKRISR